MVQEIIMLTDRQQQFILKRSLFQRVSAYISWSIGLSALTAWGLVYWLKPVLVSPEALLGQLKAKTMTYQQLAEIAVTGSSAVSALFFIIIFIAVMIYFWGKRSRWSSSNPKVPI